MPMLYQVMFIIRNINRFIVQHNKTVFHMNLEEFQFSNSNYGKLTSNSTLANSNSLSQQIKKTKKIISKGSNSDLQARIQTLNKILEWRKTHEAPVDTMGCERLADPNASVQVQKFQTLVSLMLSIQTKDEITSMCVNRLKQYGLTAESMSKIQPQNLIKMIYECNFNKRKAKCIIQTSQIILKRGKIASTKDELLEYPGVGVKIAMIYLNVAENQQAGIGVDTHVHRITNKLGWVKADNPNQTQIQMQQAFPRQYWKGINIAFVGFGQLLCTAKKPMCKQCPVSGECPSAQLKW